MRSACTAFVSAFHDSKASSFDLFWQLLGQVIFPQWAEVQEVG
jgi:hypothetical protein